MMFIQMIIKRCYHRSNINTIQWNKTLRNHQINGNYEQALKLFQLAIEKQTFQPDSITYLTILDVCKQLKSLTIIQTIHQLIDSSNFSNDHRIRSSLMDVYIKCNDIDNAYRVFQSMKERNVIDYGTLMNAFNHHEQYERTWIFSKEIPSKIKYSSSILCTLILQACVHLKQYDDGVNIHRLSEKYLSNDRIFMNELMNFYLKFQQENQALKIFENHSNNQTIIDYSLLMKYYNRQYQPDKTLQLYQRLKKTFKYNIDHIIYVLVLQAIANGCCLYTSQQIEDDLKKFQMNIDVKNALINMYGKLGDLNRAEQIFNTMSKHNIVSYNILLNLYGLYQQSDKALKCYNQMCQQGHRPDDKTFVLLLNLLSKTPTNISHVKRIYGNIEENKRGPMLISTLISALIRAELFDEVKNLLKNLPNENLFFYAIKSNINKTNDPFDYPMIITNEQLTLYELLINNIYSYGGFHDHLTVINENLYNNQRLKQMLSYSWFENSNGNIEYFKSLNSSLSFCEHTEKNALEKQNENSILPILIGKNHRTCFDCHEYLKKFSLSSLRKNIYLRDSTRLHLFSSGKCSCEISS